MKSRVLLSPNQDGTAGAVVPSLPPHVGWAASRSRTPANSGTPTGVPHCARLPHTGSHPVHVTLRAAIRCLRSERVFPVVRRALAAASCAGFRVVHFSVQDEHIHLLVEADDKTALTRGLRGLTIRVARGVNRVLCRRGPVWNDRYHVRQLTTPREMRHALVYVLMNRHKHRPGEAPLDPCSSATWFDGWRQQLDETPGPPPVVRPRTWLAAVGWRRHGLLSFAERPRS